MADLPVLRMDWLRWSILGPLELRAALWVLAGRQQRKRSRSVRNV